MALSYIAAQRIFPDYGDMADAKSLLESITPGFGYHYGVAKIRVNTVSQSPTVTTAGSGVKGFDEAISYSEAMSPLGNGRPIVRGILHHLFSDLTRFVTMQNLADGGFSNTGVSMEVISKFGPEEGEALFQRTPWGSCQEVGVLPGGTFLSKGFDARSAQRCGGLKIPSSGRAVLPAVENDLQVICSIFPRETTA